MSRPYAWRVLGILPILKASACTNQDKGWQSQRRISMFHRAMDPVIAEINELCKTARYYRWADKLVRLENLGGGTDVFVTDNEGSLSREILVELRKPGILDGTPQERVLDDRERCTCCGQTVAQLCKVVDVHSPVFHDDEEWGVGEAELDVLDYSGFLGAHGGILVSWVPLIFEEGGNVHENTREHCGG